MSGGFDIVDERAPGWRFRIKEISMGAYEIEGRDAAGRSVSRQGGQYDELFNEVVADAVQMSQRHKNSN